MIPATRSPSSRRKEGPNSARVTMELALPPLVFTTTATDPVVGSSGLCALIWPGLANDRYASLPLMVTLVPPRDLGKLPDQVKVPLARLVPKIDIHSFGWMTFLELSNGTTPFAGMDGAGNTDDPRVTRNTVPPPFFPSAEVVPYKLPSLA